MQNEIVQIIRHLDLKEHPEGGYYKETYRSAGVISQSNLGVNFDGERNYCTAIYFLLTTNNFSAFHKIKQDETWHFYKGSSLFVHVIDKEGVYTKHEIGNDFTKGAVPQFTVPAGQWFASSVEAPNSYALVGCTVSPGFDFRDFEIANRQRLAKVYPQHQNIIKQLTRI